jgi:hypothetical protein
MPKTRLITLRSRLVGGLGGFGISAVFSLILYYRLSKDLLKSISNPYLKIASGVGMGLFGLCISPIMMLIFGGYGARFGVELGADMYYILIKGMLDSAANQPPAVQKGGGQSTTELAFLLQTDNSAAAQTIAPASKVIAFPGGQTSGLYARSSVTASRPKPELQIDTRGLTP